VLLIRVAQFTTYKTFFIIKLQEITLRHCKSTIEQPPSQFLPEIDKSQHEIMLLTKQAP
jgi:hypothetical protein